MLKRGRIRFAAVLLILTLDAEVGATFGRRHLRRQRELTTTGSALLSSSPQEDYMQQCQRMLGSDWDLSKDTFVTFISYYCHQNIPGPACADDLAFASLPVDVQIKFVTGTCPEDEHLLECLQSLIHSGDDFFFAGNSVDMLCTDTYPLLKSNGFIVGASTAVHPSRYYGVEVLPPETDMMEQFFPKSNAVDDSDEKSAAGQDKVGTSTPDQEHNGPSESPTAHDENMGAQTSQGVTSLATDQLPQGQYTITYGTGSHAVLEGDKSPVGGSTRMPMVKRKKRSISEAPSSVPSTESSQSTPESSSPSTESPLPSRKSPAPYSTMPMSDPPSKSNEDATTRPSQGTSASPSSAPTIADDVAGDGETNSSISTGRQDQTPGREASVPALAVIGVGLAIAAAFASIKGRQRNKKRGCQETLQTTDHALNGDASISSERSSTFRFDEGEFDTGLVCKKSHATSQFKMGSLKHSSRNPSDLTSPKSRDTSTKLGQSNVSLWSDPIIVFGSLFGRKRFRLSPKIDADGDSVFFPPSSPYLIEEDPGSKAPRTDPIIWSAETRGALEPTTDEPCARDVLQSVTTKDEDHSESVETFISEADRNTWRSTLTQPFSGMLVENEEKRYFVDETPLGEATSTDVHGEEDSDSIPKRINMSATSAPLRNKPFACSRQKNIIAGNNESSGKDSPIEWQIQYKDTLPEDDELPKVSTTTGDEMTLEGTNSAAIETLKPGDEVVDCRPWRSGRDRPFSTVFGEQQGPEKKTSVPSRRGRPSDNRYVQLLAGPPPTTQDSLTVRSEQLDEESLGSLAFICPDIIRQFQEVDQRLSEGFKQFQEVDDRISEEFDKLESNFGGEGGANLTNDDTSVTSAPEAIEAVAVAGSSDAAFRNKSSAFDTGLLAMYSNEDDGDPSELYEVYENDRLSRPEPLILLSSPTEEVSEDEKKPLDECFVAAPSSQQNDAQIDDDHNDCSSDEDDDKEEERYQFSHLQSHFAMAWYQNPKNVDGTPPVEQICNDFVASPPSSLLAPAEGDDSSSSGGEAEDQGLVAADDFNFEEIRSRFAKPAAVKNQTPPRQK